MEKRVRTRLTAREGRRFGLTVGIAFAALGGLLFWRENATAAGVAGGLGALLILAGLAIPTRLGPVEAAWMKLAHLISKVTTPIFMAVVYFIVLTPAGFLVRLFGHKPLVRKRTSADGYWVARERHAGADMRRQF